LVALVLADFAAARGFVADALEAPDVDLPDFDPLALGPSDLASDLAGAGLASDLVAPDLDPPDFGASDLVLPDFATADVPSVAGDFGAGAPERDVALAVRAVEVGLEAGVASDFVAPVEREASFGRSLALPPVEVAPSAVPAERALLPAALGNGDLVPAELASAEAVPVEPLSDEAPVPADAESDRPSATRRAVSLTLCAVPVMKFLTRVTAVVVGVALLAIETAFPIEPYKLGRKDKLGC
jgi:hypothetical protein